MRGASTLALLLLAALRGVSDVGAAPDLAPAATPAHEREAPSSRLEIGAETAARMGIETTLAAPAQSRAEVTAYGRILDPSSLVEPVLMRASARSVYDAARSDLTRVEALHAADRNASTRELESARTAVARAHADLGAASARVALAWGPALAERSDLDALASRVEAGSVAVARIDLPAGERSARAVDTIAVDAPSLGTTSLPTRTLGPAPTTDAQLQGPGLLLLVEHHAPPPGTALVAQLPSSADSVAGARVPRAAVVYADGASWVWVELAPGSFENRRVSLVRAPDGGWVATNALQPGERIVTRGAQQLLSALLLRPQAAD